MSKKNKSFIHENKNPIIALLFIVFLLVLLFFYGRGGGELLIPEGNTQVDGGQVALSIGSPPREAIQGMTEEEQEIEEPTTIYHAQDINKRHDFGLFETELKSLGFYEHDGVKEFRMDIWVHNVGDNAEDFLWEKANILKIPNEKYNVTSAEFDGSEIPSGEEREGYLLFKDVPEDINGDIIVVIGNSVTFSTIFGFTTQAPHKYEITLE